MTGASRSSAYHPCGATRHDGHPCSAPTLGDAEWCFAHDPGRAEQRQAARRKGGRNRANAVRLRGLLPPRLAPVFDALEAALAEVHDGSLSPTQATAMAALSRAMVAVLQAGELEERVRLLERQADL